MNRCRTATTECVIQQSMLCLDREQSLSSVAVLTAVMTCDFAQSYGVINASWLRKFSVPSSNQSRKMKKAWFLDHSLWFSKPNAGTEKARTSYKSCIYFSDRLKASWMHCVDRPQAKIWNSQKNKHTAVGLVFSFKEPKNVR